MSIQSPATDTGSILEKIRKIRKLADAEINVGNKEAGESFLAKAYDLQVRHGIVLADLKEPSRYIRDDIPMGERRTVEHVFISGILREFFSVEIVNCVKRGRSSSSIAVCGTKENVEIAIYVYHQLTAQYKASWEAFRKRNHQAQTTMKRSYYEGLMYGIFARLSAQKTTIENEMGLTIVKDPGPKEFAKEEMNTVKGAGVSTYVKHSAITQAGVSDSRKINIGQGIKAGPDNTVKRLN